MRASLSVQPPPPPPPPPPERRQTPRGRARWFSTAHEKSPASGGDGARSHGCRRGGTASARGIQTTASQASGCACPPRLTVPCLQYFSIEQVMARRSSRQCKRAKTTVRRASQHASSRFNLKCGSCLKTITRPLPQSPMLSRSLCKRGLT
jgi:hypothetical protein